MAERALGNSSPQSLRKILDDDTESATTTSAKKRHMGEGNKDSFMQLPQPPKKQKTTKQPQLVPPIIIGLFEPPPQAALFPPIASSSFHDSHGRNSLNTVPPKVTVLQNAQHEIPEAPAAMIEEEKTPEKTAQKRKSIKARKMWTEDETRNLLLGVQKHGVGNWADIIEDNNFLFNGRTSADLKDRFRTCCPNELRGKSQVTKLSKKGVEKSKSSLMSENILIDDDEMEIDSGDGNLKKDNQKSSRAHRKKLEDLAELGIDGPFQKSSRRERRAFTEEEDRAILTGWKTYGASWTKIQRDSTLGLQSRKPTDLRDRFRNKYPDKFREGKSGTEPTLPRTLSGSHLSDLLNKDDSSRNVHLSSAILNETSSNITSHSTRPALQSIASREGLRIQEIISAAPSSPSLQPQEKELSRIPSFPSTSKDKQESIFTPFTTDSSSLSLVETSDLPFSQSFDWNNSVAAPFSNNIGEMDISRLLLDETWPDNSNSPDGDETRGNGDGVVKGRQSYTDINSLLTSNERDEERRMDQGMGIVVASSNVPSFFNVLNDPDEDEGYG